MTPSDDPPDEQPDEDPDDDPNNPDDPDDNPDNDPDEEPDEDDDEVNAENLTQAITLLAKSVKNSQGKSASTKVREPDAFDGTDPKKLRVFLVQCQLNFKARPVAFESDEAKVNYALSYLKGTALEWFEPGLMDPDDPPSWLSDYAEFTIELQDNFGPHDPVGDAEAELEALRMKHDHRITKYAVQFNRHAAALDWGPSALRHQFYRGLPTRIKDEIARIGKPLTLPALRRLAQDIDSRYWARQEEISRDNRQPIPAKKDRPEKSSDKRTDNHHTPKPPTSTPNHSGSSGNATASSKKPDLSSKLGKDGKLTPDERQRRFKLNLCLFCGGSGHTAKECPKSSSSASKAKARSAKAEDSEATSAPEKD
jgi:hypothetical protein